MAKLYLYESAVVLALFFFAQMVVAAENFRPHPKSFPLH